MILHEGGYNINANFSLDSQLAFESQEPPKQERAGRHQTEGTVDQRSVLRGSCKAFEGRAREKATTV